MIFFSFRKLKYSLNFLSVCNVFNFKYSFFDLNKSVLGRNYLKYLYDPRNCVLKYVYTEPFFLATFLHRNDHYSMPHLFYFIFFLQGTRYPCTVRFVPYLSTCLKTHYSNRTCSRPKWKTLKITS